MIRIKRRNLLVGVGLDRISVAQSLCGSVFAKETVENSVA